MISRALTVTGFIIFGHLAAYGCAALSRGVQAVDDVSDPADDKALHDCRQTARAVKSDSGSGDAGMQAYLECVKEAGI